MKLKVGGKRIKADPIPRPNSVLLKYFFSPYAVIASLIIGLVLGVYTPAFSILLGPIAQVYVSLLQMTVIPILITAVVASIARLIQTHGMTRRVAHIFFVFIIVLTGASALGLLAALIFQPGTGTTEEASRVIGEFLSAGDASGTVRESAQGSLSTLLMDMIPENPVAALSEGKHLAILFVSILFGLALGFTEKQSQNFCIRLAEETYAAFLRIVRWVLYGLPLGMLCMIADQVARTGFEILRSMGTFLIFTIITCFVILFLQLFWVKYCTRLSLANIWRGLRPVAIVAFATRNSYAAMPVAIEALSNGFRKNATDASLLIPLSVNLSRQGTAFYTVFSALFFMQLYQIPMTTGLAIMAVLLGTLSGMVPASLVGIIPVVFIPLGLPPDVGIMLLLAIDVVVDPLLTVLNITGCCVTSISLSTPEKELVA